MLWLRGVSSCPWRSLHRITVYQDQVLGQLQLCSVEEHVFDVVDKNEARLNVNHVSLAVKKLLQFRNENLYEHRNFKPITHQPQFLTLRILAENQIQQMNDEMLMETLYYFLRLKVHPHDSLIQQLVLEGWLRLDRLSLDSLSIFAICLRDQNLQCSPLMGHITNIVDQKLSSINSARILSSLMVCVSFLVSPRLRDALISKADHLLDSEVPCKYKDAQRIMQFLYKTRHNHWPLWQKCSQILLRDIPKMDARILGLNMEVWHRLNLMNFDLNLAAKQRLTELIDSSTDPVSFTNLFISLAPLTSPEIRVGLENTALVMADEINAFQAVVITETLVKIQSKNLMLKNKIASVIQKNLHFYKTKSVFRITKALLQLHDHNPELLAELRNTVVKLLQDSICPYEVAMLISTLAKMPYPKPEYDVIQHVDAVVTQCNLRDLRTISGAITKWISMDPSQYYNPDTKYVSLLQTVNRCSHERLQKADRLELVLAELKRISGEWLNKMLREEIMVTLKRMMDQINWTNVPNLALFLSKMKYFCPPLMERIASVAIKDMDKIHYTLTAFILAPFSSMNYVPERADEFYDVCIRHITPHFRSLEPDKLVLLVHTLGMAGIFPEELIKEVFSIDFLRKFDSYMETLPHKLALRAQLLLMQLNRIVCLECPQIQVPWFHKQFCQKLQKRGNDSVSNLRQQTQELLGEVLGGENYIRAAVVTPYYYTIGFVCILDKNRQPLPYNKPNTLKVSDGPVLQGGMSLIEDIRNELPPVAQCVAVDFVHLKHFCRDSKHMTGQAAMKKRHLEILGFRVVQIPHFEWNSKELSTPEAWREYLRKNILRELSP
ncbi:FAST kinase domain-containing protein 1, mitochondrial [Aulostomus maculatus]